MTKREALEAFKSEIANAWTEDEISAISAKYAHKIGRTWSDLQKLMTWVGPALHRIRETPINKATGCQCFDNYDPADWAAIVD